MEWLTDKNRHIIIDGKRLECRCWGPAPDQAPTIILLHEGLGSCDLWRDFPEKLAAATGYGVFAYSRAGYGQSDPAELPLPLDFIEREALNVLPLVLDAIGLQNGLLLGHSDGASIAAFYAGSVQDFRLTGACLIAPHFFTEPMGLAAISQAKIAFDTGNLHKRLSKHHRNAEDMFRSWNGAWLHPGFKAWNIEEVIPYIRVPVLAIQGRDDQYGTLAQIKALEEQLYSPFEMAIIDGCKHAPQLEKPEEVLAAIRKFLD